MKTERFVNFVFGLTDEQRRAVLRVLSQEQTDELVAMLNEALDDKLEQRSSDAATRGGLS